LNTAKELFWHPEQPGAHKVVNAQMSSDMQTTNETSPGVCLRFPFLELHGFRALLFDWDGVLVDSGENYYRAYEMVLRDVGVSTTPREIYLRQGQPTPQVLAAILKNRGLVADESRIRELVERRREYDFALGERKFFAGICDVVQRLRDGGYRIGMVTGSSRKSIQRLLNRELERLFDVVITADDVALPKPDPQPFTFAASTLGLAPERCLVIENAPFGIEAARAAGCPIVGICTTLPPEDLSHADWVVQNHDELMQLLAGKDGTSFLRPKDKRSW